jgi:hypothetical protein
MRFAPILVLGLVAAAGLTVACFGNMLVHDELPGYRDAAHYYYPLYLRVQQEWNAGRLPLWSAEENAGMPLLGNPTAAVLYPGKFVFGLFSYAWAIRLYTVGHLLLAAGAMFALLRHWNVSRAGSIIGALSYAFGAPILFQYCNIIFLVGASWAPLGLRAADRWVRQGKRWGIVELGLVLALQTLGGDPESAYVLGLCAAGYAAARSAWPSRERLGDRRALGGAVALVIVWIAATLLAAHFLSPWPERQRGPAALRPNSLAALVTVLTDLALGRPLNGARMPVPWGAAPFWFAPGLWRQIILLVWAAGGLVLLARWRRPLVSNLVGRLAGLAFAAVLGGCLMGVQLLPTLEYTGLTVRAAEDGSHEVFPFSVEPYRIAEFFWPGVYGTSLTRHASWLSALPPEHLWKIWVPTLYVGGFTILLALGGAGWRDGPPWRAWLTVIGVVSFLGAMGMFASPLWVARLLPGGAGLFGPLDPTDTGELRRDGHFPDGFGSPYWLMAQLLPGFGGFRYPAKLMTFTCLAISGLAACGWDRAMAGRGRRAVGVGLALSLLSMVLLAALLQNQERIVAWWLKQPQIMQPRTFGPFDPKRAFGETVRALEYGAALYVLGSVLLLLARRRPAAASAAAIVLVAFDLALAHQGLVITVPRGSFEGKPEVLRRIEEAEARDPADGPYRIHRMPIWEPLAWQERPSSTRIRELMEWEHRTIQPKYAIPYGTQYTLTQGVAELYDYWFFFAPFHGNHDDDVGASLGLKPGVKVVYFPRRGFDLWNTRYFVVPRIPANDERRGIASFLFNVKSVYPDTAAMDQAGGREVWDRTEDWQILRNEQAFPRAWVVHDARILPPIQRMSREPRERVMEEILYEADAFWNNPSRALYDPRELCWIESSSVAELAEYRSGGPTGPAERVEVRLVNPCRTELEVTMERPGFVILADVNYPGWTLTIDGKPAPILKANRTMRGAAVGAGRHRLVYRYEPRSLRLGASLSAAGLAGLLFASWWAARQRPSPHAPA